MKLAWVFAGVAACASSRLVHAQDVSPDPVHDDHALKPSVVAVDKPVIVAEEEADPAPPPPPDIGLGDCTFFPDPACPQSIVAELGFGFGQNLSNLPPELFVARTFLEVGLLTQVRLPDHIVDLHVGPVFALAVETSDIPFSWIAGPRVRARYFVGGTHFVVEHSVGPQFQRFVYHDALETGTRMGFAADFAFGYRGIVGPWGELSVLGDPGGNDGTKLQWLVGIRANLLGWAAALGGFTEALGN